MFQDCAIEDFIAACQAGLKETRYGDDYITAVQANLDYWLHIQTDRKLNPWTPDAPQGEVGHYVVVRATRHACFDEWTNIGCMVFDDKGKQVFRRMGPFGRAIYRGDLDADFVDHLINYGKKDDHIDIVHRALDSTGHCMSSIQMTVPRLTRLSEENFESIYHSFVLGLN